MRKVGFVVGLVAAVLALPLAVHAAESAAGRDGKGMAAIRHAAGKDRHLFLFLYKTEDRQTKSMRKVFEAAMADLADKAESVVVHVGDRSEKAVVDKLKVARAPMPLVLVLAPNGARVGAFVREFDADRLAGAFASPCMAKCLKALQERRLVFLCVQNDKTEQNGAAMRGVRDFQSDKRFSQATEIVTLDPGDRAEKSFLSKLRVDPKTAQAVTVFLAPPGSVLAKYEGATNKNAMVATLMSAMSSCGSGSGCGPSGCP